MADKTQTITEIDPATAPEMGTSQLNQQSSQANASRDALGGVANSQTTNIHLVILQSAASGDGKYLVSQSDMRDKTVVWKACDDLVNDGLATWDKLSTFAPCIRLTEKALNNG